MKSNYEPKHIKVKEILDDRLFVIPAFQRNLVWGPERRIKFIENVRNGDPFGVMLIRAREDGKYEIIDGLQRVTTIKDYYENKFDYLDANVLDGKLLRNIIEKNLISQGIDPNDQSTNYYEEIIKKIREVIFSLLKQNKKQMEVITSTVNEMGFIQNNTEIMQGIIDVCDAFNNDTNIDELEIEAINYFGPSENIPQIFYNLNTGAVSLTKYETYAALWSYTNFKINDNEIIEKVLSKYETLAKDSNLEVDYDEDEIRNNGISLFEYCFALGQIIKKIEEDHKYISINSDTAAKTDPSGFELLTLVLGEPINNAKCLQDKLKNSKPEFLVELKDVIKEALKTVFDALDEFAIGLNGSCLLTDSDYLIYHIVVSYIREYYVIDTLTSKVTKQQTQFSIKSFKKYMPYVYLHDIFTDFWKINRQVSDLTQYINDENKRHKYWSKISDSEWQTCFSHFFSLQGGSPDSISKNNKLFVDLYTKLNLEQNYPGQITKFKEFFVQNNKDIKLDYEHIVPKKRIKSKLGDKQKAITMSRIGNLCYLSIKDNRSKGKNTIYEFIKDRPALDVKDEYLSAVDYPKENELGFLDYSINEFVDSYNKYSKERENRLEKNILEMIKKRINSL